MAIMISGSRNGGKTLRAQLEAIQRPFIQMMVDVYSVALPQSITYDPNDTAHFVVKYPDSVCDQIDNIKRLMNEAVQRAFGH